MEKLSKISLSKWVRPVPYESLVCTPLAKIWCKIPYPGHPKGCPNFGKGKHCPPNTPYITEVVDFNYPIYFVYHEFDLASHIKKMRQKHPNWSERQLRCVLYWQRGAKNRHREIMATVANQLKCDFTHPFPNAIGVNVYVTCKKVGIPLEKIKNATINRYVGLIGTAKHNNSNIMRYFGRINES